MTTGGYFVAISTVAVAPSAAHVPSTTRVTADLTVSKTPSSKSRIVPVSSATSGMTFSAPEPAWKFVTDTTADSAAGTFRETTVCRAATTCAPATTGSTPLCGCDAWPPAPVTEIRSSDDRPMTAPAFTRTAPTGAVGRLCRP